MDALLKLAQVPLVIAFQFGEVVVLSLYVGIPFVCWARARRTSTAWTATVVCATALVLHCCGFKVFGRPVTASLEKLRTPRRVARLEAPNVLHFSDGSTAALAHVFFPVSFDPNQKHPGHYETARGGLRTDVLFDHKDKDANRRGIPVEVSFDQSGAAQATYLRGAGYFCGNTWTPQFFPERLPSMVRDDFAVLLIKNSFALPTAKCVESQKRHNPLLGALSSGVILDLPKGHPEVIRLAMAFLRQGMSSQGVELLVLTRATNLFPEVKRSIQNEISSKARNGALDPAISNNLASLLLELDPQAARTALNGLLATPQPDTFQICSLANAAAKSGDLGGFDKVCEAVRGNSTTTNKWTQHLRLLLRSYFRFDIYLNGGGCPDDITPEFLAWYDAVRPRLSYAYSSGHREGFSLDNGEPFSPEYYASMRPYKEQIATRHGRAIYRERFYDE